MFICVSALLISSWLFSTGNAQNVRLAGGSTPYEGRVELFHDSVWGSVCDDVWTVTEANVICRQLFSTDAVAAKKNAYFGDGFGMIWLDDVTCNGYEDRLDLCSHRGWGTHNCVPSESAGVICNTGNALRLAGGTTDYEGRVEIFHNGVWGTVCDDYWDMNDAAVVCRQLFATTPALAPHSAYFGQGTGRIWLDDLHCTGKESSLDKCRRRPWGLENCVHHEDAGVRCNDGNAIRLVDGSTGYEGRVEIFHKGQWGTVCDDRWSISDANVVCEQLFGASAIAFRSGNHFKSGSGQIWLDEVQCSGNEGSLSNCPSSSWGSHDCSHGEDAGVSCNGGNQIRLVGGSSGYEGRVEIFHDGQWGTVCDDEWEIADATVVCRQLFSTFALSSHSRAHFGQGSGEIFLDDVACLGTEERLDECAHSGWSNDNCGHGEDAGVVCSGGNAVRLVGGKSRHEGRVEIFYNGVWGTVCDDSWSLLDAHIVCRQLFSVEAIQAKQKAFFGEGSGEIWLDDVACCGSESSLDACHHSAWSSHNCDHCEDAGVICSETVSMRLVEGFSHFNGRLEVRHNGQWGTVCKDGWDFQNANVVCRLLFMTSANTSASATVAGSGPIFLDHVSCSGSEQGLEDCTHSPWGEHDCTHSEDVGVSCRVGSGVRLVGGQNHLEGRVEVFHNGQWGTVCDDYWSTTDADVVCRQLGFGLASSAPSSAYFSQGSGPIWLDDVACSGGEAELAICPSNGWGNDNCGHYEDAGVVCTGPQSCSPLPALSNGASSTNLRAPGTTVLFSCNSGYALIGSSSRTCLSHGVWSGTQPSCAASPIDG